MTTSNRFACRHLRRHACWLFVVLFVLPLLADAAAGSKGRPVYVKRETWAETILAFHERYTPWWERQLAGVKLGPWHTTERERVLSPSRRIDLGELDDSGNRVWAVRPELLDGVVHYDLSNHGIHQQRRLPCGEDDPTVGDPTVDEDVGGEVSASVTAEGPSVLFQIRGIEVPVPTTLTAWLGAEYGLEVWLDGRKLFSNARLGSGLYAVPEAAKVKLPLVAGKNQLVLRFLDVRRSGFYFSTVRREQIDPDPAEDFLERMEQDFPVPTRRMLGDVSKERVIAWFRGSRPRSWVL